MIRIRTIGLALMAVFAMGAVMASAASAANPTWGVEEAGVAKELKVSTETRTVEGKANGTQKLNIGGSFGSTIACKSFKVSSAKIIGGEPGTDQEIIEYGECEVEGKPNCEINGKKAKVATITTNLLTSKLVFRTKKAAEEGNAELTDTLFEPKSPEKVFVSVVLSGTCPLTGTFPVEGQVAAENVKGGEHLAEHELNAPATAISEYFTNPGATKVAVKALTFDTIFPASYVGKSVIKLAGGIIWWIIN